jgi:hypothetical protein
MTETPEPVDAGTETASDDTIPRTEARKAFESRDKARAELKEARAKLASIEKAQADATRAKAEADGDLRKQIDLLASERDKIAAEHQESLSQLASMRASLTRSKVESSVLSSIPDPANHEMTRVIIRDALSARASDDASEADLIAGALDGVKKIAPHFLEKPREPVQTRGYIPTDSAQTLTRSSIVSEAESGMRKLGLRQKKLL